MLNVRVNHAPVSSVGRVAATVVLALITVFAAGFSAQSPSITGVVTDQLGHPIADTALTLVDLTTNAEHKTNADQNGRYEFASLTSGDYMMKVFTPGFKNVEERVVLANTTLQRDVQLQLAMVHETIFVVDGPSTAIPDSKRDAIAAKTDATPMPDSKRALMGTATPGTPMPASKRELIERKTQAAAAAPCPTGGGCIVPPTKLVDKKPVFPDSQAAVGGIVTLSGIIDATGHVSNLQVVGTANPDLAQAAIAAVTQWEFVPTRLDGQVVDTAIQISVTFKSTR